MRQCDKLQADVEALCAKLQRPISSKDLLRYYSRAPEDRPLLFQRLGQQLFKLARPKGKKSAFVHRVGIIGNLAFYAPDTDPKWADAFSVYGSLVAVAQQRHFRLPDYAARLLRTRFEAMARNALAGYVEEFRPIIENCPPTSPLVHDMSELLEKAEREAASVFIQNVPTNLISRDAAAELLRREYGRRTPMSDPGAMNVARHLVHLKWPQSSLFPSTPGVFWADQVEMYCASRWPVTANEHELARGLSLVMIYGQEPVIFA